MSCPVTTPIGTFGKGVPGSITLNFAPSGGANCSNTCAMKGAGCYAQATENRKPSITVNLTRKHENRSAFLTWLAEVWQPNASIPWIRFSSFGSVPFPGELLRTEKDAFRTLANKVHAFKVHFPVETKDKYRSYEAFGFDTVRLSLQQATEQKILANARVGYRLSAVTASDPASKLSPLRGAIQAARALAARLRSRGIKVVVCPAIGDRTHTRKCGRCTACADNRIAVIIYPKH